MLEKSNKRKSTKRGKKKHTCTPSESSEGVEDLDRIEVASKHNDRSDVGKNSEQKMPKFEKCLEAMANRGKLREASHD